MKKYILPLFATAMLCVQAQAQEQKPLEGIPYALPQTAVRLSILVEKTHYQPGRLAKYAEKYMKLQNVELEERTQYRIVDTRFHAFGVPDSTKLFVAFTGKKHTINDVQRYRNGVIMAINAKAKEPQEAVAFVPARRQTLPKPEDYMNADILAATSSAKMAELIAKDVYDIRESRNMLSRGQAEFMPKDGEQLKLMLNELQVQESALMQTFEGVTSKDTTEVTFVYIPTKEKNEDLLFRFSKYLGMCDKDDLGGTPYYIKTDNLNILPELPTVADDGKLKDYAGVHVNMPGKIRLSLYKKNELVKSFDLYAAQFGNVVALSGELFSKKQYTELILDPVTGNIEHVKTETLK